ncbi:MAG: hypothetical protein QOD89_1736 [Bradyrhizobium sp.]|jgi:hypothetical protein|nr:hypothetical protein [Bradyrhizobium sp.]
MSWRDHLVMMLTSGAEIEHALMVQYLFAAYSINGDQESEEDRAMVEGWRTSILTVAKEEMGHLLTVQNMLTLLGAPVNLGREMMPWDHQFYPFKFSLEPLSKERLQCFIYAEMPRLEDMGAGLRGKSMPRAIDRQTTRDEEEAIIREVTDAFPDAQMHQIGELYAEIIELIGDPIRIPDSAFNEASYDMQASWDDWGRGYKPEPRPVTPDGNLDPQGNPGSGEPRSPFSNPLAGRPAHVQIDRAATRAQAVKALRALATQGEAPHLQEDETGEPSHFERFAQIYRDFKEIEKRKRPIKATHDVRPNPTTRVDFHNMHPEASTYIGIAHKEMAAHYLAQLFNQRYRLLLTHLAHSFRLARTPPMHQPGLRGMAMHRVFGEMYNLKAIAGLLVRLPIATGGYGGPPFEMPYTLDLPPTDADIWRLLADLIASSSHTCRDVFRVAKVIPVVNQQITGVGGDVYLRSLIEIDNETQKWIAKVLAGHGSNERAGL